MDNSLYTSGEWTSEPYRSDNDQQLIKTQDKTKLIAVVNEFKDITKEEAINNSLLMAEAKNLLQIAEMFYDHMRTTNHFSKTSIPFTITETLLKKLKSR